jgi:hypothetical protein
MRSAVISITTACALSIPLELLASEWGAYVDNVYSRIVSHDLSVPELRHLQDEHDTALFYERAGMRMTSIHFIAEIEQHLESNHFPDLIE